MKSLVFSPYLLSCHAIHRHPLLLPPFPTSPHLRPNHPLCLAISRSALFCAVFPSSCLNLSLASPSRSPVKPFTAAPTPHPPHRAARVPNPSPAPPPPSPSPPRSAAVHPSSTPPPQPVRPPLPWRRLRSGYTTLRFGGGNRWLPRRRARRRWDLVW